MIEYSVHDGIGVITIARPETGNAVTGEMAESLGEIVSKAAGQADVLILTGKGPDFTVGRDRQGPKGVTPFDSLRKVSAVNNAIAAFPGVLIAKVRGRAIGLGVGLTMRSDISFASSSARFCLDEVSHGIPPMFIMEEMVNHLPPKRAIEIVLSGREFGAEEALQMGLLSRMVADEALDGAVMEFANSLRSREQSVILACKEYLRTVRAMPVNARPAYALLEQTEFALRRK